MGVSDVVGVVGYWLSAIGYRLSAIGYRLSMCGRIGVSDFATR